MRFSGVLVIATLFWLGVSYWKGELAIAVVSILGHYLIWQNHVLEVKLNKLLDDRGIHVSNDDININV